MILVGDAFVCERRFSHGSEVQHSWTVTVTKVTPKRAYFGKRDWIALDDPSREVKPRYLDYITTATPAPNESYGHDG